MVKSGDGGGGGDSTTTTTIAPFLKKCYDMVDEEATDSIISWSPNGDSFIIWDMTEFSVKLLPVYFKHSNSSSFVRQLNIYGFRKVDPDRWEFANDGFIRGQKHLLKNITRRKNPQGSSNRKATAVQAPEKPAVEEPCEEVEKVDLCKEIENLKIDRNAVTQELGKLRQHQESADKKLLLVRDRLKGMETNQQQMLSFLVLVMQHPGFVVQLLNPKENGWRMAEPGSIVEQGADENEPLVSDGSIVRYQPTSDNMGTRMHHGASNDEGRQDESPRDWMKDFSISSDFMKLLSEETFATENNHKPFVMPEIRDDTTWEQLLLGTCSLVNNHGTKEDGEEADYDSDLDIGRTLPSTLMEADVVEEQMEEFMRQEGAHLEEQMYPLASETSLEEGNATYMM